MELGCGVGLPGVCAVLQAAQLVAFQDYNAEVLTSRTIPTAFYNGYSEKWAVSECGRILESVSVLLW